MTEPAAIRTFRYVRPETGHPKTVVKLARTDRLVALAQVVNKGGETNLHSHSHLDGFWFILSGRARFYSDKTVLIAELGPREGIMIPRGTKYWFEAVGDEPLEFIQVECSDVALTEAQLMADRTDFTPHRGGTVFAEAHTP